MAWTNAKTAVVAGMAVLLAGGVATMALARTHGDNKLTPQQIIKKSQDVYASLSSYSDEGKSVATVGTTAVAPHIFSIKLARPNLYRIEWDQNSGFFDQKGAVWSAGHGDFLKMQDSIEKQDDREQALGGATGISGSAAASIPGTFFKMNWGNQLGAAMWSAKRKADEKVGDTACYVLTQQKGGRTQTLWIGKRDFLIRQVENVTTGKVMSATLQAELKKHPELQAALANMAGDVKSIETHMNIVVNKACSAADFDFQASKR